jgi:hypothetical protein
MQLNVGLYVVQRTACAGVKKLFEIIGIALVRGLVITCLTPDMMWAHLEKRACRALARLIVIDHQTQTLSRGNPIEFQVIDILKLNFPLRAMVIDQFDTL